MTPGLAPPHWLPIRGPAPAYREGLRATYRPNRPLSSQNVPLLVVPRIPSKRRMACRAFTLQTPPAVKPAPCAGMGGLLPLYFKTSLNVVLFEEAEGH